MKKMKLLIFILLVTFLVIVFLYGIFGTGISYLSSREIKQDRELNEDLIKNLKINDIDVAYDKNNNTYYYTLSDKYENKIYVLKLELGDGLKYKLVDETLNIVKVNYNKPIDIIIYNDKYYYETKIQLTNLPIIMIDYKNQIGLENVNGIFTYINNEYSQKTFTNNIKIKVRGATTYNLPKKPYRINFYNKTYTEEKKVSFSNFYIGDSLVLDGVYREHSKIRNVLSTELWNDISDDFTDIDMYSEFVEVFLNDEYVGLYVLNEPVNRTKFKLNKTTENDTSFVVKSTSGYHEIKYPNNENYFLEIDNKINFILSNYFEKRTNSSYESIVNTFDIKNYIDIIIYNYFINNIDNRLEQNVYYYNNSLNENFVYIQPWDMEWTFGRTYNHKISEANIFDCTLKHENSEKINKLIINRYWELRKSIITEDYFNDLIDRYLEILNKGATSRDSNRWYYYDINEELTYIKNWIRDRIKYTDEKIRELENE